MGIQELIQILTNKIDRLNIQRSLLYTQGDVEGVIKIDLEIVDTENIIKTLRVGLSILQK